MIQHFKDDVQLVLLSQKSIESSCLNNVGNTAPDKLQEIKSDIKYFDLKENIVKPRIRKQEINTVFQLSFKLDICVNNRKFISLLKSTDANDMFNQSKSGTRSKEFTIDSKAQTEEYYYIEL